MASVHPGHLPYPVPDFMSNYQQAGYPEQALYQQQYDRISPKDLAPMHPDPYDRHNSAMATGRSLSNNPYEHYRAKSLHQQRQDFGTMNTMMRYEDRVALEQAQMHHRRQKSQAAAFQERSEEKAVGGVSAKLDYDMDKMTDFVAEMAVGMYAIYNSRICIADIDLVQSIKPGIAPPPTFRKWVLQVLNATRLPSATILLSLSYLSLRVRGLSASGRFMPSDRSLYQMLTVALILGSKFLDDNTFQNKSWAEVSNISVAELNRDERDWLTAFGHRLHHDPQGPSGYLVWENKWVTWQARHYQYAALMSHPVEPSLRSERSMRQSLTSPYRHTQYSRSESLVGSRASEASLATPYSAYDSWHGHHSGSDSSPSTAPYSSGPHTPEYYNLSAEAHGVRHAPYGFAPLPSFNAELAAYQPQYDMPAFDQRWSCHSAHCQCNNCRTSLMHTRYGTVAAA